MTTTKHLVVQQPVLLYCLVSNTFIFVLWWFLVGSLLFHRVSASRQSDSTPDSRRVSLCVDDYRAFRTVQAALQTATP